MELEEKMAKQCRLASRAAHVENTCITVGGVTFGGGACPLIAGPCSVESEEQIVRIAKAVKVAGADMLRGGVFKPRTSPYSFQGLGEEGMRALLQAKRETGLGIVTEIMNMKYLDLFNDVDIIQIGARNMQNFDLLKGLGSQTQKPILLKRGLSATLSEVMLSAEYLMSAGNPNVIICERGIRTFSTEMRNTPDLAAIAMLKDLTHLPVIADPSHATGIRKYVTPVAVAAAAIGADGLIVEVHDRPDEALSDGDQSLSPQEFAALRAKVMGLGNRN